jgi:hypothetical protein
MLTCDRFITAVVCVTVAFTIAGAQSTTPKFEFAVRHRVNAHGDEFNALAKSSDGQRAYIAAAFYAESAWLMGID